MEVAWILIITSVLLILYTYLFYPWLLQILPKKEQTWASSNYPYSIAVLIAAYNEESVIQEKLTSVLNHIPEHVKLDIFVGSDASTDRTDDIVKALQEIYPNVFLERFAGRTGKASIINALAKNKKHDIFILTDANVLFTKSTISELLIPFQESKISMVCANIVKIPKGKSSFEHIEKSYIDRENRIKKMESDLWRIVIGAEGGCYAIRNTSFREVPRNFFMDDFFITMQVLERKQSVVFQEKALCYEDIPIAPGEEFKRKKRISIGNFQNLSRFKGLLLPNKGPIAFAFFSHKVLRWLSPFFLLCMLICSGYISFFQKEIFPIFLIQLMFLLSPLLSRLKLKIPVISTAIHFYSMNIALFVGFFAYLKGVKSSVWEPTSRVS
ncbi:MAG: glycosyltransferase [Bacteroidetes bacterium]|nr:glycosyltransferase [Bacteroidota bacterium]